jgi:hypothetical protein
MADPVPKTELMRSLGRLTRGLSALFWGLPITLLVAVQAATTNWLAALGPFSGVAPAAAYALLFYGLWLMRDFQKQERVWLAALDQAKLLGLVNVGLAPFLHWYQRLPQVSLFASAVTLLAVTSLLFLLGLNRVLRRLAAMLPDETLRVETAAFTTLNGWLLLLLPGAALVYVLVVRSGGLSASAQLILQFLEPAQHLALLFLTLLPLAITMSLAWKIKEAILAAVFGEGS